MDSENRSTNVQTAGLDTQKKRKWRKRGKQGRKQEDVENGSSDCNVFEGDAQENVDEEEKIMFITDECRPDSPNTNSDMNEDSEYSQITTDALGIPSTIRIEPPTQRQISETNSNVETNSSNQPSSNHYQTNQETLKRLNLISDNKISFFNDGISTSFMRACSSASNISESTNPGHCIDTGSQLHRSTSAATEPDYVKLYNPKALPKDAPTYQLETFVNNVLIIFNQRDFFHISTREGTDKDVEALTNTFKELDFIVLSYTNRTLTEIEQILQAITNQDFTDYGCVAVAILTHGGLDGQLWAKDESYTEMDIINCLKTHKNHSLITKPRLLMIQACRGPNALAGVDVLQKGKTRTDLHYDTKPYTLPVESDMLVLHSSYPGNRAHRVELYGTWFIQTLCKKIKEMASTHDLETILVEVKREVAIDREHKVYNKVTDDIDINKQIPVVTSTLIRKLYLRKYGDDRDEPDSGVSIVNDMGNPTIDTANDGPNRDTCLCALDYFDYIKKCLRYYVNNCNKEDSTAKSLLVLAETFRDDDMFNVSKEKCALSIAAHLQEKTAHLEHYKFLHIHKHL